MNDNKKPQVYILNDETPQTINDPFANMNMEKDELKNQKLKNKMTIIIFSVVIFLLLIVIFIMYLGSLTNKNTEVPEAKENLEDVSLDLNDYISEYNLDALDAYGTDDLLMVAINHICYGVYDCKVVSSSAVSDYLKTVFNKEISLDNVQCSFNDGVLYNYDAASGRFIYNESHTVHDLLNTESIYSRVNSIKKKNDKYILVLNKLYYNAGKSEYISSDPLGINKIYNFSDYDMPSENGNVIDMTKLISDYNSEFDKIKNKGNRYQYTFSKNGKNYILEKYEVINTQKKGY